MTNWRREIRIKQFLDPDSPFEGVRDQIVEVLKRQPEYAASERGDDGGEFFYIVDEMADTDTVDYFDLTLNALYDWADAEKVWIGGDLPSTLPSV